VFSCFLKRLGAENTVNTVFLYASQAQNHVFTVFFAPGSKNHCIYSVLWPAPSKNSGIYAVFSMLQDVLFPCQKPKNTVNYCVLAFDTQWKTSENNRKCPNWSFSFKLQKTGGGSSFLELSPARLRPHLSKRAGIRASPPTPPRLASLRFAYTNTQPRPSAGFVIYTYIYNYIYITFTCTCVCL